MSSPDNRPPRRPGIVASALLPLFLFFGTAPMVFAQGPVEQSIDEQTASQRESAASQGRIDQLDDETRIALEEYRQTLRQIDQLRTYNTQMERMIAGQESEISGLEREISTIETTKRQILPLMRQMLDVLDKLIAADAPFLLEERLARLQELETLMQQAGTSLAEKFRRLMEAYQIEMEYGNTIEAYRAELPRAATPRTVEFLRIGRTELYYLTLDEREAGIWDKAQQTWRTLPSSDIPLILQGLRLARKELPPDLIRLPVSAPEKAL